ncbi:DNA replication terminus site-binding protein [Legionella sp. CNM-1927-20]|uniref:DNA replication terminus site-binding protein n=1 Tax=Legionella sp. CNM-1927-20 TaxID=3422221 RepID=UPI00403ADE58
MSAIDIIDCFNALLKNLEEFKIHVYQELKNNPVWINDPSNKEILISDYNHFIAALTDFYPGDLETPQHTKSFQGALGGNLTTLQLVNSVNKSKDQLKAVINEYLNEIKTKDTQVIHTLLKNARFPRLKLKQVYRHIPCIDYHPRRITFTQVKHNSHKVISKKELAARLDKIGKGRHIDVQQQKLQYLDDDKLAIHRDTQSLSAVNIATFKNEEGLSFTRKLMTSMPIVYLQQDNLPLPEVGYSRRQKRSLSTVRSDKKIEDEVFLPSAAAYRYKHPK